MEQIAQFFRDFGITTASFAATTLNFIIVLVVLRLFAYKPILAMLEERKKRIAEAMENAEKVKQELAAAQEQRTKVVADANTQVQKLFEEARLAADQIRDRTVAEARRQAEAELRRAQQQIAVERERMLTEARSQITALVINTTAKVSGKVLTADDQRRLSEETSREIAA